MLGTPICRAQSLLSILWARPGRRTPEPCGPHTKARTPGAPSRATPSLKRRRLGNRQRGHPRSQLHGHSPARPVSPGLHRGKGLHRRPGAAWYSPLTVGLHEHTAGATKDPGRFRAPPTERSSDDPAARRGPVGEEAGTSCCRRGAGSGPHHAPEGRSLGTSSLLKLQAKAEAGSLFGVRPPFGTFRSWETGGV